MITKEEALECLEDMDDYARMTCGVDPIGPYNALKEFIELHYQDSLRWKKAQELNLDIGVLHAGYDVWFEYYEDSDIDKLIQDENIERAK